jgi:hypothetical protein
MTQNTPKNFALQLGALVSLYLSLSFLLVLLFGLINLIIPDAADSSYRIESASTSVRLGFAMLIVFFPTLVVLTRIVNRIRRQDESGSYLGLTRWLIYLSLLVGGLILLGDLVFVIMAFLEGELTARFIFKALSVLVVVGAAFFYYLKDAQSYWLTHQKESVSYGAGATAVVIASLVFGLYYIETPQTVREQRLDEKQIEDLRDIQWHVINYISSNNEVPESAKEAWQQISLDAPENRDDYEYNKTENGFSLCATFDQPAEKDSYFGYRPVPDKNELVSNSDDWHYEAGRYCFERKVNLEEATPEE